jgi:heptosyltransferase-2
MNILIIGPSWVGDSVMAQSLYIQLKKEDPDCNIDVVSPPWTVSIMERMPQVSRNIVSPFLHGDIKLISRNRFGKSLKKFNYDRSIILTNSFKSALVPYFAKIPIRTGWLGEFRYGLLNDIRKLDPTKNHLMVEKFVSLSLQNNNYFLESLDFPLLTIDLVNQKNVLSKLSIDSSLRSLAICPGAEFGPAKQWPTEYYAEVARAYIDRGWNILCLGSPNDQETGEQIESFQNLSEENKFYNLIGKTSLNDAIDILGLCDRVVTNDSGLMHIAAAVGTPLVALYGPSSPAYTPPLIDNKKILRKMEGYEKKREGDLERGYHQSLVAIKPTEVINALEELQKL